AHQGFAVAPEPVDLSDRLAPAVHLPRLQPDPHHPARSLLHGAAEDAREILACGHQVSVVLARGYENLRAAELVQAETDFVVLGEALRLKDTALVCGGELRQRIARKARADPAGGHEAPQDLSRRQILPLELGELITVDAVRELR